MMEEKLYHMPIGQSIIRWRISSGQPYSFRDLLLRKSSSHMEEIQVQTGCLFLEGKAREVREMLPTSRGS
jgi:hypothetical protein